MIVFRNHIFFGRKILLVTGFFLFLNFCPWTCSQATATGKDNGSLVVRMKQGWLRIEPFGENIIRITFSRNKYRPPCSFDVLEPSSFPETAIRSSGKTRILETSSLICEVNSKSGYIRFIHTADSSLALEALIPAELKDTLIAGENTFSIRQDFRIDSTEGLYGLGQHQDGIMNWHGRKVTLIQKNMEVALPFLLSSKNYGILWDNPSHTEFSSGGTGMSFWSEVGDAVDFYIIPGRNADSVISGYRRLTGQVPMLPKWAYGYWQSKERYKSRKEVMDIARKYRSGKLPVDVIVQDWQYWGKYGWSSMLWDEKTYPDPASMLDSLHRIYHVKLMISVWPHVQDGCPLAAELDSCGLLFKEICWNKGRIYDAYSSKARDIYWKHLNKGLFSAGVDGWWLDATEPELNWAPALADSKKAITRLGKNALGTFHRYLNSYPFFTCRGIYDNQRKTTDQKRVVILTRSAWTGQQRTGAITWSGDIASSFSSLKNQVAAGLNFCMSGNPYWNTDIGGFFPTGHGGEYPLGIHDMAFRELYLRWFQFGVFCPVFRSHGTGTPREIWQFGDSATYFHEVLRSWDQLRYQLLPYIYSLAWKTHSEGYTTMRALVMDFPADKKVYAIGDEYMFGPAYLVKPVTEQQYFRIRTDSAVRDTMVRTTYDSVDFYLPAGSAWYDFYTGRKEAGGRTVRTASPLEVIPAYIREGTLLPYGPMIQYSTEKPADPLELRIYPGRDADFELYEDENDGYNYEKGVYSLIPFHWNDKSNTLTISSRSGNFPGMLQKRKFRIALFGEIPEGFQMANVTEQQVIYSGKEIKVKIK